MKFLMIIINLTFWFSCLYGQEAPNERELTLSVGLSFNSIRDNRLSAIIQESLAPKYAISYRSSNNKRINQMRIQFSSPRSRNSSLLGVNTIRPQVFYSYEIKVKEGIWLGGFIDHNTMLNFASTSSASYNNNSINYIMSQSVGPRISYVKSFLSISEGHRLQLRSSLQTSLLSYVVQPAFAHSYPSQFLKDDVFTPTRDGMAWPLVKSGKLATLNQYRSFRVELGLFYQVNNSFMMSIDYNLAVQYGNTRSKAFSMVNSDIMVSATYLH